jgi:hypothetical protein
MQKGMTEDEISSLVDNCLKEKSLKEKPGCMSGGITFFSIMLAV